MSTTGERIAQLRKQHGYTQAKLAQEAGISTSSIAMYETNRRQPDEATMALLASALGVGMETLHHSTPPQAEAPAHSRQVSAQMEPTLTNMAQADKAPRKSFTSPQPNEPLMGATHVQVQGLNQEKIDAGWTNLSLSREEARFILFMRMHPDSHPFLHAYMNADAEKRKQVEKAWRLIQVFQT